MARCPDCDAYEQAVMTRAPDGPEPPEPCAHYEMSEAFQTWLVDRMRGEVMGQISGAGLDRMAIVKPLDAEE